MWAAFAGGAGSTPLAHPFAPGSQALRSRPTDGRPAYGDLSSKANVWPRAMRHPDGSAGEAPSTAFQKFVPIRKVPYHFSKEFSGVVLKPLARRPLRGWDGDGSIVRNACCCFVPSLYLGVERRGRRTAAVVGLRTEGRTADVAASIDPAFREKAGKGKEEGALRTPANEASGWCEAAGPRSSLPRSPTKGTKRTGANVALHPRWWRHRRREGLRGAYQRCRTSRTS